MLKRLSQSLVFRLLVLAVLGAVLAWWVPQTTAPERPAASQNG